MGKTKYYKIIILNSDNEFKTIEYQVHLGTEKESAERHEVALRLSDAYRGGEHCMLVSGCQYKAYNGLCLDLKARKYMRVDLPSMGSCGKQTFYSYVSQFETYEYYLYDMKFYFMCVVIDENDAHNVILISKSGNTMAEVFSVA